MPNSLAYNITKDDLSHFGPGPAFVTFGEVMVRDTPADMERPERTRLVHLSMAGSEYTLAMGLCRLGIPSVLHHPRARQSLRPRRAQHRPRAGRQHRPLRVGAQDRADRAAHLRDRANAAARHGHLPAHVLGRLQAGRGHGRLAGGAEGRRLFHTSGITFGLAAHSKYERNYNYEAFQGSDRPQARGLPGGAGFQLPRHALDGRRRRAR